VVVGVLLAALLLAGAITLWRTSAVTNTTDRVAAAPIAAPPAATGIPAGFVEAWRAPSAATVRPAVVGPAVVTADGGQVSGRDARTGAEAWTYTRNSPLCAAAGGFPFSDNQRGRVLALYRGTTGFCSEMTALSPDTGARVAARNSDVVPGTELVADDTFVLQTGERYLEVIRSDLVKTLEYGAVIAPAQPDRQPRTGCRYGSVALADRRLAVVERCPDETAERLTVMSPDPADSEKPEEQFSVLLPAAGPATVVTLTADRVAVALSDPPRLQLLDAGGSEIEVTPLDVPEADLATDPPGLVAPVQAGPFQAGAGQAGKDRLFWWTGSRTIALNANDLTPRWTIADTLGPALPYGDGLLVPVRAGLADVDPRTGKTRRIIPVPRADPAAPVRLGAAGDILLEQRGPELVALRPV
jgi:PQQ-like domain